MQLLDEVAATVVVLLRQHVKEAGVGDPSADLVAAGAVDLAELFDIDCVSSFDL